MQESINYILFVKNIIAFRQHLSTAQTQTLLNVIPRISFGTGFILWHKNPHSIMFIHDISI